MDLFVAGAESTSNTIEFLIMYLILNPDVQKKLQEELDRVLQRSRRPNLDDKNQSVFINNILGMCMYVQMVDNHTVHTHYHGLFITEAS